MFVAKQMATYLRDLTALSAEVRQEDFVLPLIDWIANLDETVAR